MFFRDWLLRHPPTSVLLVVALLLLLMGLFPGPQRPPELTRIQETSRMDPTTVTTTAMDRWSTAAQFNAVLNAPIAFGLALAVVALVIWRVFEWAYKMRLDKAQFYIEMAALEHAKERSRLFTAARALESRARRSAL
jgi:hypothetical protein